MNRRSSTAELVAATRARHQHRRARLVDDPYAIRVCGPGLRFFVRWRAVGWLAERTLFRRHRTSMMCVLIRARYADRALEEAVARGVDQYAMIGAGLDSFVLRRPDLMERLDVFELDLPEMQAVKRERFARAGLEFPPRTHFVAADLSRVPVMEALRTSPFDPSRPAFFSLLGLTYYLTPEDNSATFASIASGAAPGSEIVLDYMLDDASAAPGRAAYREQVLEYVEKRGEPMRSDFSLEAMSALMAEAGFETVENVSMMELARRYTREIGPLPYAFPGLYACGHFRRAAGGAAAAGAPR